MKSNARAGFWGQDFFRLAQGLGQGFFDLIFPPRCGICERLLSNADVQVCTTCQEHLERIRPPLCQVCGLPGLSCACHNELKPLEKIRSLFVYDDTVRKGILALKLKERRRLALFFGSRLASSDLFGLDLKDQDLIVPVPLHRTKLAERGFNQAVLLAEVVSRKVGVPLDRSGLVRNVKTDLQGQQDNKNSRFQNVQGAFHLRHTQAFFGKRICLLDDVVTSGATLVACAQALLPAKPKRIQAVTIARRVLS